MFPGEEGQKSFKIQLHLYRLLNKKKQATGHIRQKLNVLDFSVEREIDC